jgi:hypothetical protein
MTLRVTSEDENGGTRLTETFQRVRLDITNRDGRVIVVATTPSANLVWPA